MSMGGSAKKEDTKKTEATDSITAGTRTEQLKLDQKAIDKIISDVLGSESGLASIFGGEQGVGIYNSSSAAQASGDLVTNLVGELAKITGKNVIETDEEQNVTGRTDTRSNTFGASANVTIPGFGTPPVG